jgi:Arc/MetJ-type ribon-helix-helix transcriptional regulator
MNIAYLPWNQPVTTADRVCLRDGDAELTYADVARRASVDAEMVAVAQQAVAQGQAESMSAWVNDALRLKADHDRRLRALDAFLGAYEAEHGEISEEEMREAARSARRRAVVVRGGPDPAPEATAPGGRGAA